MNNLLSPRLIHAASHSSPRLLGAFLKTILCAAYLPLVMNVAAGWSSQLGVGGWMGSQRDQSARGSETSSSAARTLGELALTGPRLQAPTAQGPPKLDAARASPSRHVVPRQFLAN